MGAGDLEKEHTRQERREERQLKRREKMLQHSRGFIQAYKNAILKRIGRRSRKKE
ncbi:MAG: hypothetical protein WBC11_00625 [Dehalococcoidia bacterium]